MTTITENKDVYAEFKLFKNIYTTINAGESLLLYYDKDSDAISLTFDKSDFSIFTGTWNQKGMLEKWLKETGLSVRLKLSDFKSISKALKKNVKSISYNETSFKMIFEDKETASDVEVILEADNSLKTYLDKINSVRGKLLKNELPINSEFLKDSLLKLFLDDSGSIIDTKTHDKLIEIPSDRILSVIKKSEYYLRYSLRDEKSHRYILIGSKNPELGLNLEQIFLTI